MKKLLLLVLLTIPFMLQAQWTQIGNDIDGETTNDTSGFEVDLNNDGDIIVIGSWRNDDNGNDAGQVRVYQNISGDWTQIGSDINGEGENDMAGFSVSANALGDIIAVGAPSHSGAQAFAGQVRILQYNGTDWVQVGNEIEGDGSVNGFGSSVSLSSDGSIVAIGEIGNDTNGNNSGSARIFGFDGSNWAQIGGAIYGEAAGDLSGTTISLSSDGNIVAIGAIENDGLINN